LTESFFARIAAAGAIILLLKPLRTFSNQPDPLPERVATPDSPSTFKLSDTLLKLKPFLQRAGVGFMPIFYLYR
jgi:hypothetical protein